MGIESVPAATRYATAIGAVATAAPAPASTSSSSSSLPYGGGRIEPRRRALIDVKPVRESRQVRDGSVRERRLEIRQVAEDTTVGRGRVIPAHAYGRVHAGGFVKVVQRPFDFRDGSFAGVENGGGVNSGTGLSLLPIFAASAAIAGAGDLLVRLFVPEVDPRRPRLRDVLLFLKQTVQGLILATN